MIFQTAKYCCMSFTKLYFLAALSIGWAVALASAGELTKDEKKSLLATPQGGVVLLNNLWARQLEVPVLPLKISDDHGPQFLLSDKPEYLVTGNGIALQEEVKAGMVRLYLYHVTRPTHGA